MDFSAIFQLRTKKFWWMDVIFYFVISLLIATVLCWLMFLVKNVDLKKQINDEILALQDVGTNKQKQQENSVINYQKKIRDFIGLLENHEFASNVFAFMRSQTMPNVWFNQFGFNKGSATLQLSGEAEDMAAFSRQIASLEGNKNVKSLGNLSSSLGQLAKTQFNMSLSLNQNIFSYLANNPLILETTTPPEQLLQNQTNPTEPEIDGVIENNAKLILSFGLSNPKIIGLIDQTNYVITLNVPSGTDIKNLTPAIFISPKAAVLPASGAPQDFTNPIEYTVTAQDGTVQKYEVRVNVNNPPAPAESPVKDSNQSWFVILIVVLIIIVIVAVAAAIFIFLRKRSKNQQEYANKIDNTQL